MISSALGVLRRLLASEPNWRGPSSVVASKRNVWSVNLTCRSCGTTGDVEINLPDAGREAAEARSAQLEAQVRELHREAEEAQRAYELSVEASQAQVVKLDEENVLWRSEVSEAHEREAALKEQLSQALARHPYDAMLDEAELRQKLKERVTELEAHADQALSEMCSVACGWAWEQGVRSNIPGWFEKALLEAQAGDARARISKLEALLAALKVSIERDAGDTVWMSEGNQTACDAISEALGLARREPKTLRCHRDLFGGHVCFRPSGHEGSCES